MTFSLLVSRFANKSFHHRERVLILDRFGGDIQIFFEIMDQEYHQMDSSVEQMLSLCNHFRMGYFTIIDDRKGTEIVKKITQGGNNS